MNQSVTEISMSNQLKWVHIKLGSTKTPSDGEAVGVRRLDAAFIDSGFDEACVKEHSLQYTPPTTMKPAQWNGCWYLPLPFSFKAALRNAPAADWIIGNPFSWDLSCR